MTANRAIPSLAARMLAVAGVAALSVVAMSALSRVAADDRAAGGHEQAAVVAHHTSPAGHAGVLAPRAVPRARPLLLAFAVVVGVIVVRAGRRRGADTPAATRSPRCSLVAEPGASRAPPRTASC